MDIIFSSTLKQMKYDEDNIEKVIKNLVGQKSTQCQNNLLLRFKEMNLLHLELNILLLILSNVIPDYFNKLVIILLIK